jgi:hypothetical protein
VKPSFAQVEAKEDIMATDLKHIVAAFTLAIVSLAPAKAACWNEAAVSAAKIRDLETMLMVSALRCRASDNAMIKQYNRFVARSRPALTEVNETLRAHFANSGGLNAYDRYVTALANHYGAGATGLDCNDMKSILSAAEAEGGSVAGLGRLAKDAGVEPRLTGGLCAKTIAAAQ